MCKKFPYPAKDGESIAIMSLVKEYAKMGISLDVLALNTKKHFCNPDMLPEEIKQIANFQSVYIDTGLSPWKAFYALIKGDAYTVKRFYSNRFVRRMLHLIQSNNYDFIQLEGSYMLAYIDIVRKYFKGFVSLRSHNVEFEIWERLAARETNFIKRRLYKYQYKSLKKFELDNLNKADVMVTISKKDEKMFSFLGCKLPIHTATAGIDEQLLNRPFTAGNPKSALFIGGLDWIPNLKAINWFIAKALPKIKRAEPNFTLCVAGRNTPSSLLSLKKEGLKVLGEIDDALSEMEKHTFLIVPLREGSGMRIKIVEAMALGRVVVTTSVGAEGINAESRKHFVVANNKTEFVERITYYMQHPELQNEIAQNARAFIRENFCNSKIAAELLAFYKQNGLRE